ALSDIAAGAAIVSSRKAQEHISDQEEYIEEAMPTIPATAALDPAADFPETALIVLAYRLRRDIPSQPIKCQGDYYYLRGGNRRQIRRPRSLNGDSRVENNRTQNKRRSARAKNHPSDTTCASNILTTISATRKQTLQLLHV